MSPNPTAGVDGRPDPSPASAWVQRWSHLLKPGPVLDVACGRGRHLHWFARRGHRVVGVDRDAQALAEVGLAGPQCQTVLADIESGPWPFEGQRFSAVIVTHYLWRPLMPALIASLDEGGVLIYETFALGQEALGRPSRPQFLLRPGELLQFCSDLRVVAYEEGYEGPSAYTPARMIQRIVAWRSEGDERSMLALQA